MTKYVQAVIRFIHQQWQVMGFHARGVLRDQSCKGVSGHQAQQLTTVVLTKVFRDEHAH